MSFLYDRTVRIVRDGSSDPEPPKTGGVMGYGGRTADGAKDVEVAKDILATIQPRGRSRGGAEADLPGEAAKAQWLILLAPGHNAALPAGSIRRSYIVQDDIGRSFQVFAAEPSPMGWRIQADQLEV